MSRCHVILGTLGTEESVASALDVSMRSLSESLSTTSLNQGGGAGTKGRPGNMKHHSSSCRAFMPSIHASMSSNDSTCYLWFSKCLYLWFEIILEIIFYLKLLLYAENVLTFLCRAFAESFVTFVTARSFSSPMQRRTAPWVFRVSTAHHIPAIPATRQPKASTDRWSDGPISSVSYHQLPHPDGLAFNQRGIVGGHHKDHGGIHSLDVLKYMVLLCLNYIVLRWTILLPHCPSHKLGSKNV